MKLEDYLWKRGEAKRLCNTTGLHAAEISRIKKGGRVTLRQALLIEHATQGAVLAEDLGLDFGDRTLVQSFRKHAAHMAKGAN